METLTQSDDNTLAKAHRQAAVTQVKKGTHALQKGMSRFVDHNRKMLSTVGIGAVAAFALRRLLSRPAPRRTYFLPRLTQGWDPARRPLRKALKARSKSSSSAALSIAGLACAGALIGTGVVMLLSPRTFMGRMRQS